MPMFEYEGRDPSGAVTKKIIKAASTDEVVAYLVKHNTTPINIKQVKQKQDIVTSLEVFLHINAVTPQEIITFCRQLGTLLTAGVPIIRGLNQLAQTTKFKVFSQALSNIADDVAAGKTFSNALRSYPKFFSSVVVSIIEVGENTGHLNEALFQISVYLETYLNNHRRLVSTARYPMIVFFGALIAMIIMSVFVIPKFADLFSRFHMELPFATKLIVATSNFILNHWLLLIILTIAISAGVGSLMVKFPIIRYYLDKYKLKVPVIGSIQKRIMLSQFCWTFALILRSGLQVTHGIELAGKSTGNTYFIKQIEKMKEGIEHGQTFSQGATNTDLFFPTVIQMIEVGEETGRLEEILNEVSHFYDGEIEYDIRRLNETMEPILLIAVGGIVLVMAIGIYFPLWDLIKIAQF